MLSKQKNGFINILMKFLRGGDITQPIQKRPGDS